MLTKIVFVDLDGTLIQTKSGKTFPINYQDWKLIPKTVRAVENLIEHGFTPMLVTNQSGISRHILTWSGFMKKVDAIEAEMPWKFSEKFVATSFQDLFRKPKTGALENFLRNKGIGIHPDSIMIGDAGGREGEFSDSDKGFADNLGIKFIHVDDL